MLATGTDSNVISRIRMRDPIFTTPVVANGVLYVTTTKHLYAVAQRPTVTDQRVSEEGRQISAVSYQPFAGSQRLRVVIETCESLQPIKQVAYYGQKSER